MFLISHISELALDKLYQKRYIQSGDILQNLHCNPSNIVETYEFLRFYFTGVPHISLIRQLWQSVGYLNKLYQKNIFKAEIFYEIFAAIHLIWSRIMVLWGFLSLDYLIFHWLDNFDSPYGILMNCIWTNIFKGERFYEYLQSIEYKWKIMIFLVFLGKYTPLIPLVWQVWQSVWYLN